MIHFGGKEKKREGSYPELNRCIKNKKLLRKRSYEKKEMMMMITIIVMMMIWITLGAGNE